MILINVICHITRRTPGYHASGFSRSTDPCETFQCQQHRSFYGLVMSQTIRAIQLYDSPQANTKNIVLDFTERFLPYISHAGNCTENIRYCQIIFAKS